MGEIFTKEIEDYSWGSFYFFALLAGFQEVQFQLTFGPVSYQALLQSNINPFSLKTSYLSLTQPQKNMYLLTVKVRRF